MSYSPHRIQIVGSNNAGKSTLAARLAAETGFPRVELDALNWKPNWQGRHQHEPDEFRRLTSAFAIPTLYWLWSNYGYQRQNLLNAKTDPRWQHLRMVHLTSAKEIAEFSLEAKSP